jgi:hypothetical protein
VSESKRNEIMRRLYKYFARNGFEDLHHLSRLSKVVFISRTLFYFYFKNTEDLFDHLCAYHKTKVDVAYRFVVNNKLDFLEYIYHLVEFKDIYFFTIRCQAKVEDDERFNTCLSYSLETLDAYSYEQFLIHFKLDGLSKSEIKFMYESFRSFWFANSHPFDDWSEESVTLLLERVTNLIELLKRETLEKE